MYTDKNALNIIFFFAGGAVYYCSQIHPTVAQSSKDAKLALMTNTGKAALYLRSTFEELDPQKLWPTDIKVFNRCARQLTNAPTTLKMHTSH
jgi:hypothetical protein